MPRGSELTSFEIGQILAYRDLGLGPTEIGNKICRHKSTISRFLRDPENYGSKKRPGRPRTLDPRAERRLLNAAKTGEYSANQFRLCQQIPLSTRSIQPILHTSPELKYEKRKSSPKLSNANILYRLNWAKERVTWGAKWREILFSDEKKFNLDGPDGNQYYWHDLRKEPQYFSKRVSGGGSVMVWGSFGFEGKSEIVLLNGRQNSADYIRVLTEYLLPVGEEIGGEEWLFQQDNASIHTSAVTREWFRENHIRVIDWPSHSPDLNPIENLWGILVRMVYANGRQFNSVPELWAEIRKQWSLIPDYHLKKLADSMNNRLVEVLTKNGKAIDY